MSTRHKIISFAILCMLELCFGQNGKLFHESKFAVGLTGGLNYAIYFGDHWPEKTASSPKFNIGIDSRLKVISTFCGLFELSYLQLYYNTKYNIEDTTLLPEDRITFNNVYIFSGIEMPICKKGFISPRIGIGLAYIWPFSGTWNDEKFIFKKVNNCKTLFLSGRVALELDKYPFANSILSLTIDGNYHPLVTSATYHVPHPSQLRRGVAISKSIPLRLNVSLFWKL